MTPEQSPSEPSKPSAKGLYYEHDVLAWRKGTQEKDLKEANDSLVDASWNQVAVEADTTPSVVEADRNNAAANVSEQLERVEQAREGVAHSQKEYDANIAAGKAGAETFIPEALEEDARRSAENPS